MDYTELINLIILFDEDGETTGIATTQTPLLSDILENNDASDCAYFTSSLISTLVSSIAQIIDDNKQHEFYDKLFAELKSDDLKERVEGLYLIAEKQSIDEEEDD